MAAPLKHAPNAAYDLLPTIANYLDPHLVIPVLDSDFYKSLNLYDEKELAHTRYELARRTQMPEIAAQAYREWKGLPDDAPVEGVPRAEEVQAAWTRHIEALGPLVDIVGQYEPTGKVEELETAGQFTMAHLADAYGITLEQVEALYDCAKFRFDCGEYDIAADYLGYYRHLLPDSPRSVQALWGKFAAEILSLLWDMADKDREILRGALGKAPLSELQLLQQRSWLLHWSLFVFANHPRGRDGLLEFFTLESNLNSIVLSCPWLLRYIIAILLTNSRKKNFYGNLRLVGNVLKHIPAASASSSASASGSASAPASEQDPLVTFFKAVLVDFNFEAAQASLANCGSAIATDFFLHNMVTPEEFVEAARTLMFEVYCRVHQTIDLRLLATQLSMSIEDAEKWVINLISSAELDAKVDSSSLTVHMAQRFTNIYTQVMERTRDLPMRTRGVVETLEANSS